MKMAKRLQEYVKYSTKELDFYTETDGSCVCKVNTDLHFSLGPYSLADFKHALHTHIMRRKVGYYDARLDAIILDVKNIKVMGDRSALRADDPRLHINVNADCYVFRPVVGEVLSGVVKHVGHHHVGVIIYRVFNASIRFDHKVDTETVQMDQELKFRIKSFNLENVFPYIEGEMLSNTLNGKVRSNKISFVKMEMESTVDSGIEEKDCQELDGLISLIKQEQISGDEHVETQKEQQQQSQQPSKPAITANKGQSSKKRKTLNDSTGSVAKKTKKTPKKSTATVETTSIVRVKSEIKTEKDSKTKKSTTITSVQVKQEVET